MNSNTLASWIQVVTGIASLMISILVGLPALRGIQAVDAATPLSGLGAAQSGLIVFAMLVVFAVGLIFVIVGISALLAAAFRSHGANSPIHAAYCITLAGILAAGAATCAIFGSPVWVIPSLFALMCVILAGEAQADPTKEMFWFLGIGGTVAIFVCGSLISAGLAGMLNGAGDGSSPDHSAAVAAGDQATNAADGTSRHAKEHQN